MSDSLRDSFARSHDHVRLLDPAEPVSVERFLLERRLVDRSELPCRIARAGPGNMNLTLRVHLRERSLILKQGRPWVEKYDSIAAPWGRTLTEGLFYRTLSAAPAVARRMPALVDLDETNHILVLEDLGSAGDYTSFYADRRLDEGDFDALLGWLSALHAVEVSRSAAEAFANRAMRTLNHEHIFRLPLAAGNGLDLDSIEQGLAAASAELASDDAYRARVAGLGRVYLADRESLVHGDFFPGSWVRTPAGVRVIDPEFCFGGAPEFDYGVMLAHLALARAERALAERVLDHARAAGRDATLLLGFAGAEIMRRLIGVAQLPVTYGLAPKRELLALSRALVLDPDRALGAWP